MPYRGFPVRLYRGVTGSARRFWWSLTTGAPARGLAILAIMGPGSAVRGQDAPDQAPLTQQAAHEPSSERVAAPRPSIEPMDVAKAVALATSATLALSGGFLFAVGRSELSEAEDVPAGTPWEEVREDYDAGQEQVTLGIAMLSAGLVGSVASLAWILADQGDDGAPGDSFFIQLQPYGVEASGTF